MIGRRASALPRYKEEAVLACVVCSPKPDLPDPSKHTTLILRGRAVHAPPCVALSLSLSQSTSTAVELPVPGRLSCLLLWIRPAVVSVYVPPMTSFWHCCCFCCHPQVHLGGSGSRCREHICGLTQGESELCRSDLGTC
jgi:hypothetical protein